MSDEQTMTTEKRGPGRPRKVQPTVEASESGGFDRGDQEPIRPEFLTCFIPEGSRPEEKIGVRVQIGSNVAYIPRNQWVTYPAPYVLVVRGMTDGVLAQEKKFELSEFGTADKVPTGELQSEYTITDVPTHPSMQVREPTEAEIQQALLTWPHGLKLG